MVQLDVSSPWSILLMKGWLGLQQPLESVLSEETGSSFVPFTSIYIVDKSCMHFGHEAI